MNILTKAASIVGLIMVGGMTASMVTFISTYELTMKGESVLNLQNMLDQMFIGIVPLGLSLLCYYLLKKNTNYTFYLHYLNQHPLLLPIPCIGISSHTPDIFKIFFQNNCFTFFCVYASLRRLQK